MPDYVVIRRAPDLPREFQIGDLDGKWFDRSQMPASEPPLPPHLIPGPEAIAVPTGRFEFREDGACAEVFEFRV